MVRAFQEKIRIFHYDEGSRAGAVIETLAKELYRTKRPSPQPPIASACGRLARSYPYAGGNTCRNCSPWRNPYLSLSP